MFGGMDTMITQTYDFVTDWFAEVMKDVNIENHIWVTANRRRIPVKEMSTTHINNCVRCLEGKGKSIIPAGYLGGKSKWLKIFKKELTDRS